MDFAAEAVPDFMTMAPTPRANAARPISDAEGAEGPDDAAPSFGALLDTAVAEQPADDSAHSGAQPRAPKKAAPAPETTTEQAAPQLSAQPAPPAAPIVLANLAAANLGPAQPALEDAALRVGEAIAATPANGAITPHPNTPAIPAPAQSASVAAPPIADPTIVATPADAPTLTPGLPAPQVKAAEALAKATEAPSSGAAAPSNGVELPAHAPVANQAAAVNQSAAAPEQPLPAAHPINTAPSTPPASAPTPDASVPAQQPADPVQAIAPQVAAPIALAMLQGTPGRPTAPQPKAAEPLDALELLSGGEARPAHTRDFKAPQQPATPDFKAVLKPVGSREGGQLSLPPGAERVELAPSRLDTGMQAASFTAATAPADASAASATHVRIAVPALQVAQEIIRRFDGDTTSFDLRLDPPELGRVDVRLDVSRDHRVTATIAADNPQALAELMRHARDLEQMLQSAGLTLNDNGLSFDLRQGGERNANAGGAEESGGGGEADAALADAAPLSARPLGFERWRGVRVDITV